MLIISLISFIVTIPIFSYKISPIFFSRITSIILIYSALLSYNCYNYDWLASGINIPIFSGLFNITIITLSIEIFILFIGAFILYNWGPRITNKFISDSNYNSNSNSNKNITIVPTINEFFILILFNIIGRTIFISSNDIISIYLSIELQSFAIYIIATLYRNSESATYAGLKYYLLGGLSSTIILLGCRFIYSYTGITQFENLYILIQVINDNIDNISILSINNSIIFAIVLISFGFLFKIAAAPIHNWAPDVYDGTPTIITIWLIIIPKISIFIFILEIISKFTYIINYLSNLILICSFLSIIIGSIVGLSQYRIKRLFTYSTINHIGFILLRLSINTEISIYSFLFYLIQYSITNLNIFRIVLAFGYIRNKNKNNLNNNKIINTNKNYLIEMEYLEEFKRQFINNPILSISFCICLFSIAGVPPLIGFFAKQRVLYTSIHNNYYFISIICILISVISAFYYLKIVRLIFFDKDNNTNNNNTNTNIYNYQSITNIHSILISILTIFIILFIFEPSILINSCNIIALSIFNN
jgi:NADH-ubiquinone oxidoreductase chain 2